LPEFGEELLEWNGIREDLKECFVDTGECEHIADDIAAAAA
jgi:hypothetical protein